MTGQRPQPFDLEQWWLDDARSSGLSRSLRPFEPAPGLRTLPVRASRSACSAITVLYFGYLWYFSDQLGLLVWTAATFGYFWLTMDRWREIRMENPTWGQFFIFFLNFGAVDGIGHHDPLTPLLQFAALAPSIYICIAPSGLGKISPRLDGTQRIGRTAFIGWSAPALVLMASQFWPELDHVIAEAFSLVGPHIETVDRLAPPAALLILVGPLLGARARDIGAPKWLSRIGWGLVLARSIIPFLPVARGYVPSLDLFIAASIFVLCLWPSRPVDPVEPAPQARAGA